MEMRWLDIVDFTGFHRKIDSIRYSIEIEDHERAMRLTKRRSDSCIHANDGTASRLDRYGTINCHW